jgi:hypothetical protein
MSNQSFIHWSIRSSIFGRTFSEHMLASSLEMRPGADSPVDTVPFRDGMRGTPVSQKGPECFLVEFLCLMLHGQRGRLRGSLTRGKEADFCPTNIFPGTF